MDLNDAIRLYANCVLVFDVLRTRAQRVNRGTKTAPIWPSFVLIEVRGEHELWDTKRKIMPYLGEIV